VTYTLKGIEYHSGAGVYNVADSLVRDLAGATREELIDALREAYIEKAYADQAHEEREKELMVKIDDIRSAEYGEIAELQADLELARETAEKALRKNEKLESELAVFKRLTTHDTTIFEDPKNVKRATFGNNAARAYDLYCEASQIDEADPEEAAKMYRRAITLDPKLDIAWTNLGNCLHRLNRTERAFECWRKALEINPRQCEAHYNTGNVESERRNDEKAIVHLKKAIDCDPRFTDAYYMLGLIYIRAAKAHEAKLYLEKVIELDPKSDLAKDARKMLRKRS